jgi:hypothetical protein
VILNVANPAAPVEVGSLPIDYDVVGLTIAGTLALVVHEGRGVSVVDWNDPIQPRLAATLPASLGMIGLSALPGRRLAAVGSSGLFMGELIPRFELGWPENAFTTPGKALIKISGPSGFNFAPQWSSNLTDWETNSVKTLPSSGELILEFDANSGERMQFFKAPTE